MRMRATIIAALALAAMLLSACAAAASRPEPTTAPTQIPTAQPAPAEPTAEEQAMSKDASDLAGTSWTLSELAGAAPAAGGSPATIEFDTEGRMAGSSGCNRFFGGYSVEGATLTVGQIGSTMMACPDELMQQEKAFLTTLGQAATYTIAGDTLTITAADGATIVFTRA
ncbi:MAG: META domain-containing protein [Chloroflexales bacterium]|nr:META domain-containing protein [Chloroflexales bacterium]